MRRRALVALGLGLLVFPGFAEAQSADAALDEGRAALLRAQNQRGLLAVFIVPEDDNAAFHLGHQLGSFLMHGRQEALTALGLAEVACMRMTELRALVPNVPDGEPVLVLIDTAASPMGVTASEGPLPPPYVWTLPPELAELDIPEEDPRYVPWRRAQCEAEERRVEEGIVAVASVILRAFALPVRASSPAQRVQALLRTRALAQLSVSGGAWARSDGCGIEYERRRTDHSPRVIHLSEACGMGYVPERAQRFLYFYSVME